MLMICHNVYDKDDVKHDDILHPQGPHGEWVCTKKNIVKDILYVRLYTRPQNVVRRPSENRKDNHFSGLSCNRSDII